MGNIGMALLVLLGEVFFRLVKRERAPHACVHLPKSAQHPTPLLSSAVSFNLSAWAAPRGLAPRVLAHSRPIGAPCTPLRQTACRLHGTPGAPG